MRLFLRKDKASQYPKLRSILSCFRIWFPLYSGHVGWARSRSVIVFRGGEYGKAVNYVGLLTQDLVYLGILCIKYETICIDIDTVGIDPRKSRYGSYEIMKTQNTRAGNWLVSQKKPKPKT